jgi:phosphatidylglycerophosphate synthase
MIGVTFHTIGMKMTSEEASNGTTLMLMATALQWFSQFDIMDGLRARRLRTGGPLGRIIDEALDMIQQGCYCLWLGYLFRFDNLAFEFIFVMANIVFWTMEMKFILCKDLVLNVGEIGPVEYELALSIMIFLGGFFGNDGL